MTDPFLCDGPTMISFSGGRTSAYMLKRMLDAHRWTDDEDIHVLFANTGKERDETLAFVESVANEFDVFVHWLERGRGEVTFATASRNGEPFAQLIQDRKMLPNPVMRFCTQELKIRPMRDWMLAAGYEHWTNVVGIRADEPRRVARMREADTKRWERWERWDISLPLADAGCTLADVTEFWKAQTFDLQLQPHEGNCDLCFLKGLKKKQNIVRDRPDLAVWWMEQESTRSATFRHDQPSYAAMLAQQDLFKDGMEDLIECYCTD